jgi:hypothetical protein
VSLRIPAVNIHREIFERHRTAQKHNRTVKILKMATQTAIRPLRRILSINIFKSQRLTHNQISKAAFLTRAQSTAASSPFPIDSSQTQPPIQTPEISSVPHSTTSDAHIIDWTSSYHGLATKPFSKEVSDILTEPINVKDVEVKPDGIIYLPEIKYRRILQKAFGPGGWGLVPKGEPVAGDRVVTREYVLVCEGR